MNLRSHLYSLFCTMTGRINVRPRSTLEQLKMVRSLPADEPPLPLYLPPGYQLQQYAPGSEADWIELINQSAEFGRWDEQTLSTRVLSGMLPGGGVFVTYGEVTVACAAACDLAQFAPNAVLMYVAVLPEHRKMGLGTAVVKAAINVGRSAGYSKMILFTDDFRLAAIRTYLKLGFVPDAGNNPGTQERWHSILKEVDWQLESVPT